MRFPRSEEPLPCALQFVTALFFASYFFFAPLAFFALLLAVGCGFLSFNFACGLLAAYCLQLLLYRPHLGKGFIIGNRPDTATRRTPARKREANSWEPGDPMKRSRASLSSRAARRREAAAVWPDRILVNS